MDYQSLHIKTVVELKKLAKLMNVRVPAGTNKRELVELLMEADAAPRANAASEAKAAPEVEAPQSDSVPREDRRSTGTARSSGGPDAAKPAPKRRGRPPKVAPAEKPVEARAPAEVTPPSTSASGAEKTQPALASPDAENKQSAGAAPVPVKKQPAEVPSAKKGGQPVADAPVEIGIGAASKTPAPPTADSAKAEASKPDVPKAEAARSEPADPSAARPASPAARAREAAAQPSQRPANPYPGRSYSRAGATTRGFVGRPGARPVGAAYRAPSSTARGFEASGPRAGEASRSQTHAVEASAPRAETGRQVTRVSAQRFAPRQEEPVHRVPQEAVEARSQEIPETGSARGRREGYYNAEYKTSNPAVPELLAAGDCADGAGVLEIQPDGYGFLRAENCLPGPNDVYISIAQIRRFCLRMGDYVEGKTRPQREGDRYSAMLYITSVNGEPPEAAANRPRFEDLVPIYPDQRLRLEAPNPHGRGDFSLRLVDMLAPIGKGQRGMIVSQPKAGKTTLLKKIANAITAQYPEIVLIVLLIDERPEEVTDMKRSIDGEVIYSTFDEEPENHVRVTEMVLERAQRLVEMGKDVVVLMDSITRLARAYNLVITPTGRSLSGGLDPGALFKPKRFFGAARNIENGGSLTVIATALVETGSRMDDIIFEEFKGTGNMELHLDRKLSDKRVFPAIDMLRSGTRREELLLNEAELDGEMLVRRVLSGGRSQEMAEQLIELMSKTATNAEFFERLKGWIAVFEKEGYSLGGKN